LDEYNCIILRARVTQFGDMVDYVRERERAMDRGG
jgi:hypothetical protein